MNLIKLLLVLALLSSFSLNANAQQDSTVNNEWTWEDDDWGQLDDFKFDIEFFGNHFHHSPTISLNYSFVNLNIKNFSNNFNDAGMLELKLGHTTERASGFSEDLVKYKYHFLYISKLSTSLNSAEINFAKLDWQMWRFGTGWSNGFGYKIGNVSLIPYYSYSLDWSRFEMLSSPASPLEKAKLDLFNKSIRFGTGSEGGVRIKILDYLTLEAGYERSIIFQRHLFWKWSGSAILEAIGQWAVDEFVDEVIESSPMAAPVVNFLLKNGLSYAVYELRQTKMNWPFSNETPLAHNQFKFGVTITF